MKIYPITMYSDYSFSETITLIFHFLYIILKDIIVLLENTEKKDNWALNARYTHCVEIHINSCIVRLINFMKHHSDVYFCFI